ncbi:hypothetical protein MGN01_01330 [Methylobacterium gnaphalii]|uniref:Uncharacterized protein n=1 Tax=Methylobacterium gnaphalii TaxID=1010610 RepID=A0A512JEB6_9HYPH|nr:hypothetical protein MGN01_01330 [Methylobacterium gnaphalii]GLS51081.1 hypothetical protein GCM10007885_39350 [Methylobacterium gnaphalii]
MQDGPLIRITETAARPKPLAGAKMVETCEEGIRETLATGASHIQHVIASASSAIQAIPATQARWLWIAELRSQ